MKEIDKKWNRIRHCDFKLFSRWNHACHTPQKKNSDINEADLMNKFFFLFLLYLTFKMSNTNIHSGDNKHNGSNEDCYKTDDCQFDYCKEAAASEHMSNIKETGKL